MSTIVTTSHGISIDGEPALIQAGSLHYARLPSPELWEPVLQRIRMAGLNAVFVPFPWAYHCPAPGFHDFTGPRDIRPLLTAAERTGLWLIPYIGPWVGGGLDGGGIPAWLHRQPGTQSAVLPAASPKPASQLLRHVSAWWEQLLPLLQQQPNLLMVALHPGTTADLVPLPGYVASLVACVRSFGVRVPIAVPQACAAELPGEPWRDNVVLWAAMGQESLAQPRSQHQEEGVPTVAVMDVTLPLSWVGTRPAPLSRVGHPEHPRPLMAWAVGRGYPVTVVDPAHEGANWGWWSAVGRAMAYGYGAPASATSVPPDTYYSLRRLASTVETLGPLFGRCAPPDSDALAVDSGVPGLDDTGAGELSATPASVLAWSFREDAGAVAALVDGNGTGAIVQLALGEDGNQILVEDIPLAEGEIRILPLDWALSEGRLTSTTLEPVYRTIVAGRELIVLRNDVGGEVVLPGEFRRRHSRGPVYVERIREGVAVHFDPARIASIVLDGPGDNVLQLLVLAPERAARVWPLDDGWRTTPFYPAPWTPDEEAPARGLVIGPDFVFPEADGGFRFLAQDKGFGYRWGPWRGSDPHTWLSPMTWSVPTSLDLPPLTWESRPGAPEVQPDYDDRTWRSVAPGGQLTMEALGVDYGFVWYRAHFDAAATAVTLACRHACDLFLNGEHVAALNPPPAFGAVAPKTLPLPARHLREQNVLAMLVEHQGRHVSWDAAAAPHGLISFELDGGVVRDWRVRSGMHGTRRRQGFYGFADWSLITAPDSASGTGDITWHRATFDLSIPSNIAVPVFLVLDQTPTQCYVYLNGRLIGRIWYPRRAERRLWLPNGLLTCDGPNELLIAQWTRGASPGIGVARLEHGPVAAWHHESAV